MTGHRGLPFWGQFGVKTDPMAYPWLPYRPKALLPFWGGFGAKNDLTDGLREAFAACRGEGNASAVRDVRGRTQVTPKGYEGVRRNSGEMRE
jgi:hypothetical protein